MTIIEALKKSKKIRRAGMAQAGTWLECLGEIPTLTWCGPHSWQHGTWTPFQEQLLADDWEPVLDRKEEIAEGWAEEWMKEGFDAAEAIRPAVKAAILGALREYEAGSVEAHIKEHERLNP